AEQIVERLFKLTSIPRIGPILNHILASLSDPLTLPLVMLRRALYRTRFRLLRGGRIARKYYTVLTHLESRYLRFADHIFAPVSLAGLMGGISILSHMIHVPDLGPLVGLTAPPPANVLLPDGSDAPIRYETRKRDGKDIDFLVINGQALELGEGGALTPEVQI